MPTLSLHRVPRMIGCAIACCLAWTATVQAATITVAPGQSIQAAIDGAQPGDRIELLAGTYNEAVDFLGKAITLVGKDGSNTTVLDGTGLNVAVVTFGSGESNGSILDGVTITGGSVSDKAGGGIRCEGFSAPIIRNCRIVNNTAALVGPGVLDQGGGGVASIDSSPRLEHCFISGNSGPRGGGFMMYGGFPSLLYCTVSSNLGGGISASLGGGLELRHSRIQDHNSWGAKVEDVTLTASDCDFARNQDRGLYYDHGYGDVLLSRLSFFDNSTTDSSGGGGLWLFTGPLQAVPTITVANCVFARNTAPYGSAMSLTTVNEGIGPITPESNRIESCTIVGSGASSIATSFGPGVWFHNSIVRSSAPLFLNPPGPWTNDGVAVVTYSDIEGGFSGAGNFDADPMFVDPAADDFRLRAGSPCVDSGDPAGPAPVTDFDGNDRGVAGLNDIGYDERAPHLDISGNFLAGGTARVAIHGGLNQGPVVLFLGSSVTASVGGFGLGAPFAPFVLPSLPSAGFIASTFTIPPGLATQTFYGQAWTGAEFTDVARVDLW